MQRAAAGAAIFVRAPCVRFVPVVYKVEHFLFGGADCADGQPERALEVHGHGSRFGVSVRRLLLPLIHDLIQLLLRQQ